MYNSRMTVGSRPRQSSYHKCSLGNTAPRYNSEVAVQRKKYLVSSTQNSDDVPDWMSRTQKFHFRQSNRNRSLFTNPQSGFKNVQQTYVYANLPKAINPEGQFDRLIKPRTRNKWEMKNQTFHLEWPRPETELRKESESRLSSFGATSRPGSRQNEIMRFQMPKYGYFETPLHRQRETPIKIGHPLTVNTTYVQ